MGLEFRHRDYRAEERAQSLSRTRADTHPLLASCPSVLQVEETVFGEDDFDDPLRASGEVMEVSTYDVHHGVSSSEETPADDFTLLTVKKEWSSFKKLMMQRFPASKTVLISMVSGGVLKGNKAIAKSSQDFHSRELNDYANFEEEDVKLISQQECISKLQELKDEINQSWCAGDRVMSLRLSIKVARLLMDTSVVQFYPTLFVQATDIMDMLGDLVWNRIKQKAQMTDEGEFICTLSDHFRMTDICFDAKETCYNWFSKIGSVYELLPRIYLELALLSCWRFLNDHPEAILERLVMMTRGIADPLASTYCRLYLVQCSRRLPQHDTGFLITCINDIKELLMRFMLAKETMDEHLSAKNRVLLALIEPTIEYITRYLFNDPKKMEVNNILVGLGIWKNPSMLVEGCHCISIVLHYVLKELPVEFICSNALEILHVIECVDDRSFDQHLNFNLLGHRLSERISEVTKVHLVLDKIIQVLSCYNNLDAYLMVVDAYLDIILENQLGNFLNVILDGIFERLCADEVGEDELVILESVFLKYLTHLTNIESILALNHFVEILDMMHGSSRNSISTQILNIATRNGRIQDPTVIEVLFEFAQALYDGSDFSNVRKEDYHNPVRVISRFVQMVDYGMDVETYLRFLAQCRDSFANISELQEMLVHSCNNLAVRAMRDGNCSISFVKSCLAFSQVTLPAIPTNLRQLNLYLATAEIALLGGFIAHLDGLTDAALRCLQNITSFDGIDMGEDVDWMISLICKLCGMLIIAPGNPEVGVACIPKHILSSLNSCSWILPRMKMKVLSTIVFLAAALSQDQFLYPTFNKKVLDSHLLFFGIESHHQELLSLSGLVLEDVMNIIPQEPSMAVRGKMALEACVCVASTFTASDETLRMCRQLMEIAQLCLNPSDKFLQSTSKFLYDAHYTLEQVDWPTRSRTTEIVRIAASPP